MKRFITTLLLFAGLAATSLHAAETPADTKITVDHKDRFLTFIYDKAVAYTEKGEAAFEKAIDLAATEAPLLMEEFLRWRFWYHALHGSLLIAGTLVWVGFAMWLYRRASATHWSDGDWSTSFGVVVVCGIMFGPLPYMRMGHHIFDALQVAIAPRVYLLEQVIQLVK